jgi:hypothetical protein
MEVIEALKEMGGILRVQTDLLEKSTDLDSQTLWNIRPPGLSVLPQLSRGPLVPQVHGACTANPALHRSLTPQVALLFLLDTLCTIFVGHSLYTYFVLNFMKPPSIHLIIPWCVCCLRSLVNSH